MTDHQVPGREGLTAVSALGEPTRQAVYRYVAGTGDWVSRDQAADGVGLERGTAAHHLERLADAGLLETEYRRVSGRQGPGAGRPAKLYRRARRHFQVSLPPRDYELAARLLAEAADRSRSDGTDLTAALHDVARAEGRRLGDRIRSGLHGSAARRTADRQRAALDAIEEQGYEPVTEPDGTVVLRNCPFHQLARHHTELVCGMNHCLLDAAVETVGRTRLHARLAPHDSFCCVRLSPTP
jgi:predicted ArsR family transcriptional regulator